MVNVTPGHSDRSSLRRNLRNLPAMHYIARFARPTFDPLAFLLEHVCDPTQVPVKIKPCDLRPALAKLIHSAMTLSPIDGFVAAMTTHPPTPTGRPHFVYHIPECTLPNSLTLPLEIVSPLHSHLGRHGWTIDTTTAICIYMYCSF